MYTSAAVTNGGASALPTEPPELSLLRTTTPVAWLLLRLTVPPKRKSDRRCSAGDAEASSPPRRFEACLSLNIALERLHSLVVLAVGNHALGA